MYSSFMSLSDIENSTVVGDANNSDESEFLFEGILQTPGSGTHKYILWGS